MVSFTCGFLKYNTNKFIYKQKNTDMGNKLMVYQMGNVGGEIN